LNSSHVRRKIETSRKLRALVGSDPKRPENIVEIYLTVLSRMPTDEELQVAKTHLKETWGDAGPRDLVWALINSPEFSYRH